MPFTVCMKVSLWPFLAAGAYKRRGRFGTYNLLFTTNSPSNYSMFDVLGLVSLATMFE